MRNGDVIMLSIVLQMPDIALVVMNANWRAVQPLYAQDKEATCNFGDLMDKIMIANNRHGVICNNPPPAFLNPLPLSQNQVAHLLRDALSTWLVRHGVISQKMLVWACDSFSDFLPKLADADKSQAVERITLQGGHGWTASPVQQYAPYELEKVQRKLSRHPGNDPVEFTFLQVREVAEAMQRAQSHTNMSLGQLFKR